MPGIGEQGQRTGTPAGDEFDDGKTNGQNQRNQQRFAGGRMVVGMIVIMAVAMVMVMPGFALRHFRTNPCLNSPP